MSFMKLDADKASKISNGGAYITESNLFDVTIGAITVDINEHGARNIGAYVTLDGENYQMLYGALPLDLFDGSKAIDSNVDCFQRMMAVAQVDDIADPEPMDLPVGKGGEEKEMLVFSEFSDLECKLWVKVEYSKGKNGVIYENRIIKDIFTKDGASADEVLNGTEAGVKLGKREKFFTETKYKNVTEDEVAAWVEAGRPKEAMGGGAKATPAKKSFGKKSFGK